MSLDLVEEIVGGTKELGTRLKHNTGASRVWCRVSSILLAPWHGSRAIEADPRSLAHPERWKLYMWL